MTLLLDAAWILYKILSFSGLALALAGVGIFGWHFVRLNARAAREDSGKIPAQSWRGGGARLGLHVLASGVTLAVTAMILGAALPGRYLTD